MKNGFQLYFPKYLLDVTKDYNVGKHNIMRCAIK